VAIKNKNITRNTGGEFFNFLKYATEIIVINHHVYREIQP